MTKSEIATKENFLTENREMVISRIKNLVAVENGLVSLPVAMGIFKTAYLSTKGKTINDGLLAIQNIYGDGIRSFAKSNQEISGQAKENALNLPSSLRKY